VEFEISPQRGIHAAFNARLSSMTGAASAAPLQLSGRGFRIVPIVTLPVTRAPDLRTGESRREFWRDFDTVAVAP
jgi:hypothetical protein